MPEPVFTVVAESSSIALQDALPAASRPARVALRVRRGIASATVLGALALAATPVRADELQDVSKLVASGKLDEAETRADAFLLKTPKDAQMRFLKGVILAQRTKRDEAVVVFTGLTQDYPELPEPYNNLAAIYAAQGEYDKARLALETAVRVSPRYATAYENLGDVYAALAARSYQDARRYDATNAAALRKLDAERALLVTPRALPAASTPGLPVAPAAGSIAPQSGEPTPAAVRAQRTVGLPQPAAPAATLVGVGADAPEIIVPSVSTPVPHGSNVVGFEVPASADDGAQTSTLAGVTTRVSGDPATASATVSASVSATASAQTIAAVTAVVRRWTKAQSVSEDDLRIRVDGNSAVARFHETSKAKNRPGIARRVLTLASDGTAWAVTDARIEP